MISQERWNSFSKHDQWGNIASAVFRATHSRGSDLDRREMFKEALDLLHSSLQDQKWQNELLALHIFEEVLEKAYAGNQEASELAWRAL